jgi:hypothetical protein
MIRRQVNTDDSIERARARLGTAIIAYIDPHPAQERAFNQWYELDHFYAAAMAGPGAFAGGRWVATRSCKLLRPPGHLFGDPSRGSYLATYWLLEGAQPAWDEWVQGQMAALTASGRLFPGRDHLHTAVYRPLWELRDADGPPIEVALDRCFEGVVVIAVRWDTNSDVAGLRRWSEGLVSRELPVGVALSPLRTITSVLGDRREPHVLFVLFSETDPMTAWRESVVKAIDGLTEVPGAQGVGFGSPFIRTVPGTDTYVDQL